MVSSASDFVRSSKSDMRVRPRDPAVSVFGRLMVTVDSPEVVRGGDFRIRSLEPAATVGGEENP
jgi:hypothetical protein